MYEENIYGSYPYIVRMTSSNGRKGFLIEDKKYLNDGNTISFAQDTFSVFYQKNPYFTGNKVKILKSKLDVFNEKIAQFIIASLNTTLKYFTWGTGSTTDSIGEIKLELPFLNGKINFSYMEKFIEELEAERIEELEAYLITTGLSDYKLTKEDEKVLDKFDKMLDNALDRQTDKIRLGDIFDIRPTKSYNLTNHELFSKNGEILVVTNTSFNNGVGGYSKLEPTEKGNMITYSDTTTDSGMFYQPNDYIGYSHIQGFYPKDQKVYSKNELLYFLTCFRVTARGRFDYGTKFNRTNAKKLTIELPVKNEEIDTDFMKRFISVVEKLVIKDVVLWADKKIEASKKVIK